ncbi:histidine phosphatase family protein [Sphingopyxis sp. KK2]|uniref:histidine phosphatase family protein n=1 Tax=Sphingopyxis sp. KK2 TaxID=1855727 RepID=UPI00097E6EC3|nr:histidine phosphatase family protein [Sphingopyxis sp. KK2]
MTGFALHLLRHGSPETPGLLMGRTDGAPTAGGIAACIAQAAGLVAERLVTSDLRRCAGAAAAIGEQHRLSPVIDARWRELDFGAWDGKAPATLDADALGRFWNDPDACPPPGGERWSGLAGRIAVAIDDLEPRPTLVVTHGGAIRAALHRLCGFDRAQLWSFDLPYAALLSLHVWPGAKPSAHITGLRA